jgi:cytochrome P450
MQVEEVAASLGAVEIDMVSGPAPEELSFQPRADGTPQCYFNFSRDGFHRARLPASKKEICIVRDADTVRRVMSDPRFSLARLDPDADSVTGTGYQSPGGMLRQDLPRIRHIRHGIMPLFSEQRVAAWRKEVEDVADDLLNRLSECCPPADLNKRYFEPLIVRAVAVSVGISDDESDRLYQFSNGVLVRVETAGDRVRICEVWRELYEYTGALVSRKLSKPDDRLLSKIFVELKNAGLTDDEIVAASGTILAGFYTPYGILSVCAVELFRRPDVVDACRKDPRLWERTVEELMRYKAHFNFFLPRVATEDVTLGDVKIRAGQVLLPSLHAVVTDPGSVPDPAEFDTHRARHRHNIVFGAGPHFCPGAALARQWLQVGLERLFGTLSTIRLAKPYVDLEWQPGSISMPKEVLATWGMDNEGNSCGAPNASCTTEPAVEIHDLRG